MLAAAGTHLAQEDYDEAMLRLQDQQVTGCGGRVPPWPMLDACLDGQHGPIGGQDECALLQLECECSWLTDDAPLPMPIEADLDSSKPGCWSNYLQNVYNILTNRISESTRLNTCHRFVTPMQHLIMYSNHPCLRPAYARPNHHQ